MREFPANAVMEREMSTATKKIDSYLVVVEAHPPMRESIAVLEMISCDFHRY